MTNKKPIIKGYTFDGNEIVINYGLFKKERIANTTENIRRLNELMKNQVTEKSVDTFRKQKKGTVKNTFIGMFVAFGLSMLAAPAVLVAIPSVIAAGYLGNYLYNSYKEYKASKIEFFLKNKDDLNEGVKFNEELTVDKIKNVNKRTVNAIMEEKERSKEIFDINSIRKMNYNSLLNLRENLVNISIRNKMAQQQAAQPEVVENVDGPRLTK